MKFKTATLLAIGFAAGVWFAKSGIKVNITNV